MLFKMLFLILINIQSVASVDLSTLKPVYIALTQPDSTIMYNTLYDLSNPLSENYSNWLSKDEIDRLVLTTSDKAASTNILTWLYRNDITQIYNYGDSIKFFASQVKINTLSNISPNMYHIPKHLKQYVDFVEMYRGHIPRKYKKNYQ